MYQPVVIIIQKYGKLNKGIRNGFQAWRQKKPLNNHNYLCLVHSERNDNYSYKLLKLFLNLDGGLDSEIIIHG